MAVVCWVDRRESRQRTPGWITDGRRPAAPVESSARDPQRAGADGLPTPRPRHPKGRTMLNEQVFRGNWTEIRGRVKEKWGVLTDDDLVLAEGNPDQLIGIIERRTGESRERI